MSKKKSAEQTGAQSGPAVDQVQTDLPAGNNVSQDVGVPGEQLVNLLPPEAPVNSKKRREALYLVVAFDQDGSVSPLDEFGTAREAKTAIRYIRKFAEQRYGPLRLAKLTYLD